MRRWVRIGLPVAILAAAAVVALLYLQDDSGEDAPPQASAGVPLDWQSAAPKALGAPASDISALFGDNSMAAPQSPGEGGWEIDPDTGLALPPTIDDQYAARLPFRIAESANAEAMVPVHPKSAGQPDLSRIQTIEHLIGPGDTLQSIATRYFGSPQRYLEIYQLNRRILSSPTALPEGIRLRIPAN